MTEYEKLTDEELVELAKSGDENSESELLYVIKKTVKKYLAQLFFNQAVKKRI